MQNESRKILIIMFIAIATKLIGFAREIAIASVFGATSYTDAYLIAATIPLVIFASLGESLSTTFIPMYSYIIEKKNKSEALKFMNNILNILTLITIILSILGIIFSSYIVNIFAIGFKGETLELAIKFTKILLPGIILVGINYIVTAFLQANSNYYVTAFISFPKNIVIILSTVLSHFWRKSILVYGTLFGIASELAYQLFFAFRNGYRYKIHSKIIDNDIKHMGHLIIPVFMGMTVQQMNVLIDKALASTLSEGSIAALNFANKLESFVLGVFTVPVVMVVYTMISRLAAKNDWKAFNDTVNQSIKYLLLLLIPVSIGAMCLSTPIVKVLFQRGHFDERATHITSIALFYYSIGMTGSGLRIILSKAFYSLQDTKTPMLNGFIAIIANIVLNFALIKPLGHGGLALATSISSITGTVFLLYSLKAKIQHLDGRKIRILIAKASISSLIMGIGVKVLYRLLSQALGSGLGKEIISLFTCILLGGSIYFMSLILMQVEEANLLVSYLQDKIRVTYFFKNILSRLKESVLNKKVPVEGSYSGKQLKLLLGVSSLIEDEASITVYQLISGLSMDKYCMTLVAEEGSTIANKVNVLNEFCSSKVNIIAIPPFGKNAPLLHELKTFGILYKIIKSNKFDIVHFHSFRLASLGCMIARFLKVHEVFFTIHGWPDTENEIYTFFQRFISKISTNIICVSNFDLTKGIQRKWISAENTDIIYYNGEMDILRSKVLKQQYKISKKTPVIGMFTDYEDIYHIIKIFNKLKERKNKFFIIMMADNSEKSKCEMYVRELDLNSYAYISYNREDISKYIDDFDIFCYFSCREKVPIVMMQAMLAQKPVIANNVGAMTEIVQEGRNGYLVEAYDTEITVLNIEKLLINHNLRTVMGRNSKIIASRKFSKDNMIKEHELLYLTFKK